MPPAHSPKAIWVDLTKSDDEDVSPPKNSSTAPKIGQLAKPGGLGSARGAPPVSPSRPSTSTSNIQSSFFNHGSTNNGVRKRKAGDVTRPEGHTNFTELLERAKAEAQARGYVVTPDKNIKEPKKEAQQDLDRACSSDSGTRAALPDLFDMFYPEPKRPRQDTPSTSNSNASNPKGPKVSSTTSSIPLKKEARLAMNGPIAVPASSPGLLPASAGASASSLLGEDRRPTSKHLNDVHLSLNNPKSSATLVSNRSSTPVQSPATIGSLRSSPKIVLKREHGAPPTARDRSRRHMPEISSASRAGLIYPPTLQTKLPASSVKMPNWTEGSKEQQAWPRPRSRKFDRTILSNRQGRPYTEAEIIMVGYLSERVGVSWSDVDVKMGRSHNTCATKHTRVPHGLKNEPIKVEMKWYDRARAIDALLATEDLDLEQTVSYLQKFIDTSTLPAAAADEYERLLKIESHSEPQSYAAPMGAYSLSTTPQPASFVPSMSTAPAFSTQFRPRLHIYESAVVSNRLRPGARLADGQLDVRAMVRARQETPDSVLKSDFENESLSMTVDLVRNEKTLFDFEEEADEYLPGAFVQRKKPYLSVRERKLLSESIAKDPRSASTWSGTTLHHGFGSKEVQVVEEAAYAICPELDRLDQATPAHFSAICAYVDETKSLSTRSTTSVLNFLRDLPSGAIRNPQRLRIGYTTSSQDQAPPHQLLRRELGIRPRGRNPMRGICDKIYDNLAVSRSFTGASGDVGTIAWCPSDQYFAAGSVCLVDPNSMQYNRPNNLLFGNVERNTLSELPHHYRKRTKPAEGVNSTHSMHTSQDPRLFHTVSMVDFSHDGSYMFSTGYDNYLRAFKIDGAGSARQYGSPSNHGVKIDLLSVSHRNDLIATGAANINKAVSVHRIDDSGLSLLKTFSSTRAKQFAEKEIMPSSLKWGTHASVSDYLLAGFATHATNDLNAPSTLGELCIWNVEVGIPISVLPGAGNIFDCAWSPVSARLASACGAYGHNINRGTKSLIRVYSPLGISDGVRWSMNGLELECTAADINDVMFCPYDANYISAGATDGTVHIWDIRKPDHVLHLLRHGDALMELDDNHSRGEIDTGVRYCAWGHDRSRMYSGSSDGVLKVWDIHRATKDAHVRDIATFNSGIMSGAFNSDFSSLLIGEVNGSINLLEVGVEPSSMKDIEKFTLELFEPANSRNISSTPDDADSGITAARTLIREGQIEIQPLGGFPVRQAVKGPNYAGLGLYDYAPATVDLRKRAQEFQQTMFVKKPKKQCEKQLCREQGKCFPTDEVDDSGRSADRIPQEIRDKVLRNEKAPTGVLKCKYCGSSARIREDDMQQAAVPLCERCSFACLRCGTAIKISARTEEVNCHACALSWHVDVLGYNIVKEKEDEQMEGLEIYRKRPTAEEDTGALGDMGDLLYLVEGYYHSLWEDREPASF